MVRFGTEKEKIIKNKVTNMTNQEVIDFFRSKGATSDFKIVDSPMFVHWEIVGDSNVGYIVTNKNMMVDAIAFNNDFSLDQFVKSNLTNDVIKCYIYNDQYSGQIFDDSMTRIRYKGVVDEKVKARWYKIKKIKERMQA
jgi:hypothetical protein